MNIFKEWGSILTPQQLKQAASVTEPLRLAADIRVQLGNQGYLMDNYLSHFFDSLIAISGYTAADTGYEAASHLQELCFHVMDGKTEVRERAFYSMVKQHFKENPVHSKQRFTEVSLHFALLYPEYLPSALISFLQEMEKELNNAVDLVKWNRLYDEISAVVGEPLMVQLNQMLQEQFLGVPISLGFTYGLSHALLDRFVYKDVETGKQIFQLLLDTMGGN